MPRLFKVIVIIVLLLLSITPFLGVKQVGIISKWTTPIYIIAIVGFMLWPDKDKKDDD